MKVIDKFIETVNRYNSISGKKNEIKKIDFITEEAIDYFLKGFIFPESIGLYIFSFERSDNSIPKDYIHFASLTNYNLSYVFSKIDGSIHLWDYEYREFEWKCANNLQAFFKAMTLVIELKIKSKVEKTWDFDQSYLKSIYNQCMLINDNDSECSNFYIHILGIDD